MFHCLFHPYKNKSVGNSCVLSTFLAQKCLQNFLSAHFQCYYLLQIQPHDLVSFLKNILRFWKTGFIKLSVTICVIVCVSSGPPRVSEKVAHRQTARLGSAIKLPCPVEGDPPPLIMWTKDGRNIHSGWIRFRILRMGLKIKEVEADDTGTYICKATNGFGSVNINYTLIVIGKHRWMYIYKKHATLQVSEMSSSRAIKCVTLVKKATFNLASIKHEVTCLVTITGDHSSESVQICTLRPHHRPHQCFPCSQKSNVKIQHQSQRSRSKTRGFMEV